jgi:hypothetical protein
MDREPPARESTQFFNRVTLSKRCGKQDFIDRSLLTHPSYIDVLAELERGYPDRKIGEPIEFFAHGHLRSKVPNLEAW